MINPPTKLVQSIEDAVKTVVGIKQECRGGYMVLHCLIVFYLEQDWADYIEDLTVLVDKLVSIEVSIALSGS